MESRRDFLKKAALLSSASMWRIAPESILKALAIDPDLGTTFLDAEHVVILMQENRSFDHTYGTLAGVRGYNDPRPHVAPNGSPVWLQTNVDGETYAPFRLDIEKTSATWIGGLPHGWGDQVDARNDGAYDRWLSVKPSGYKGLAKKPITLGHYTREDIPFYYALADAFTVCDQHFCSSLTGTTPNRCYLWTGTIRAEPTADSKPHVFNGELDHDHEIGWMTFPERLEDAGISWKIYQNELDIESGQTGDENYWLSNFGDNPIEYFSQFQVRFAPRHRAYLAARAEALPKEIADEKDAKKRAGLEAELKRVQAERAKWSEENWAKLSEREKNLHRRAFDTNEGDPDFRTLETLTYQDGDTQREMTVPKGDVFHRFREDVEAGKLPTVSWLVSPQSFSDHPSSAWYGAWYVSEALDILTKNPEVWKKTIFILTYDENDGYFDHVPPFVAPNPYVADSGKVSDGIDARVEYITKEQDKKFRPRYKPRESSIGLGYRVPMVVASPWSRGGCVCSQVFDHTSVLQFLETFLSHKTGRKIDEPNISAWRRTVCGDLTSIFSTYEGQKIDLPPFLARDPFVEGIHNARFKEPPTGFRVIDADEIEAIQQGRRFAPNHGTQEPGTRKSCPLPYELYVDSRRSDDRSGIDIRFRVGNRAFGKRSAGAPFNVYAYRGPGDMKARAYAVEPGKEVSDHWAFVDFSTGAYRVRVDGPNGFLREYRGSAGDAPLDVVATYAGGRAPALVLTIHNRASWRVALLIEDNSYGNRPQRRTVGAGQKATIRVDASDSHGWYDVTLRDAGEPQYSQRLAGRIETGAWTMSDPALGA